jgi:hypothetical protein
MIARGGSKIVLIVSGFSRTYANQLGIGTCFASVHGRFSTIWADFLELDGLDVPCTKLPQNSNTVFNMTSERCSADSGGF